MVKALGQSEYRPFWFIPLTSFMCVFILYVPNAHLSLHIHSMYDPCIIIIYPALYNVNVGALYALLITHPAGWQRRPNPPLHLPVCACCCNQQSHCDPAAMWQHCHCFSTFHHLVNFFLKRMGLEDFTQGRPTLGFFLAILSFATAQTDYTDCEFFNIKESFFYVTCLDYTFSIPIQYDMYAIAPTKSLTWGQIHECVTSRWGTRGHHQWCYRGWGDDWVLRLRDVRHHRHHKHSHQHHWLSRSHKTYRRRRRGRK